MTQSAINSPIAFGKQLRLLRRRARLTQAELGIAVGYSDAQICRLETGRRPPDLTTLIALFLPALDLAAQSHEAQELLELAAIAREELIAESANPTNVAASSQAQPILISHLPNPTSHFFGRAAEQQRLLQWLNNPNIRLVSLVGLAGIGKTQLALQCFHQFASQTSMRCVFVDLVSASDPESMVRAINKALEITEGSDEQPLSLTISNLEQQPSCLLLDNCEQIQAASRVINQLLSHVPSLKLLVTSQLALRLSAEHVLQITPLAVPNLLALPPLAELAQVEAMALLLARLQVHNPKLELTEQNALALAALCVRVDGVPLAIELVAASGRLFDPEALLSELASHFLSMRRRGRDLPSRHYSVTTALTWSYQQLDPASQRLFERLSIFVSGWTVDGALAICGAESERHALIEQLNMLLDHSLIQQTTEDSTRMNMLTMVRTFAQEQGQKHVEHTVLNQRMLDYLIDLAQQAEQQLRSGNGQALWIQRLEAEHDNIRAGLNWAWQHNEHQRAIRMIGYLWRFWYMRGYLREGRRWFENLLISYQPHADVDFARALDGVGILAWRQSDYQQAEQWYQQALSIYQTNQHTHGQAQVLGHLGLVAMDRGAYDRAAAYYEQSLPLYQAIEDQSGIASTLHNLGNLYCQQSENQRASELYQACLEIYQQMGDQSGVALIALGLGAIARDEQRLSEAQAAFEQSLRLARELGDDWNEATALINLGNIAIDLGQPELGLSHYQIAKQIFEQLGDQQSLCMLETRIANAHWLLGKHSLAQTGYRQCLMLAHAIGFDAGIVEGLEGIAHCLSQTLPTTAAQLFNYAAQVRTTKGYPIIPADQLYYSQIMQQIQAQLSPAAWQQALAHSQQLSLQRVISLALAN